MSTDPHMLQKSIYWGLLNGVKLELCHLGEPEGCSLRGTAPLRENRKRDSARFPGAFLEVCPAIPVSVWDFLSAFHSLQWLCNDRRVNMSWSQRGAAEEGNTGLPLLLLPSCCSDVSMIHGSTFPCRHLQSPAPWCLKHTHCFQAIHCEDWVPREWKIDLSSQGGKGGGKAKFTLRVSKSRVWTMWKHSVPLPPESSWGPAFVTVPWFWWLNFIWECHVIFLFASL